MKWICYRNERCFKGNKSSPFVVVSVLLPGPFDVVCWCNLLIDPRSLCCRRSARNKRKTKTMNLCVVNSPYFALLRKTTFCCYLFPRYSCALCFMTSSLTEHIKLRVEYFSFFCFSSSRFAFVIVRTLNLFFMNRIFNRFKLLQKTFFFYQKKKKRWKIFAFRVPSMRNELIQLLKGVRKTNHTLDSPRNDWKSFTR